jgi:hypothetical protein
MGFSSRLFFEISKSSVSVLKSKQCGKLGNWNPIFYGTLLIQSVAKGT